MFYEGENLSKYRRTCQSSTYASNNMSYSSWLAVDGLNETTVKKGGCSHTSEDDSKNNWFMVDLVHYFTVSYVRILTRNAGGDILLGWLFILVSLLSVQIKFQICLVRCIVSCKSFDSLIERVKNPFELRRKVSNDHE